ncbi:DUF3885 domain-containing protein [Amycolatopsis sp. NPDC054798]
MPDDDLSALWRRNWPEGPPHAHELKHTYPDRWVRFHSLPESKRYPETDAEYDIVLHRYNTVLDELFHGQEVRVITANWSDTPEPPAQHARWNPGARHWMSMRTDENETDPAFITYIHLYASRRPWHTGLVDDLLRAAADDATRNAMITSLALDRIHHPYDGGADILLPTTGERDALKLRHTGWLSAYPSGF